MWLSFIIPAYNISRYINRCIESIVCQNMPEGSYEIIVIDDGSTDDTPKTVDALSLRYPLLHAVHQPNQGLSAARNSGIEHARGKYVWFVDGDDYLPDDTMEHFRPYFEVDPPDIILFAMCRVGENRPVATCPEPCLLQPRRTYSGWEALQTGFIPASACNSLYRLEFLRSYDLRFNPEAYREDVEFTGRVLCLASSCVYLDIVGYYYYRREGSITRNNSVANRLRLLEAEITIADSFTRFARKYGEERRGLTPYMSFRTNMILFNLLLSAYRDREIPLDKVASLLSKSRERGLYPMKCPQRKLKYYLAIAFLNVEPLYLTLIKYSRRKNQ